MTHRSGLTAEINLEALIEMAFQNFSDQHQTWVTVSNMLCAGDGHLMMDIQRLGRLDLVLRLLEQEFARSLVNGYRREETGVFFADDFRQLMSNTWILLAYETVRLISERDTGKTVLRSLRSRLELVRMPLVKGAIARTNKRGYPGDPYRPTGMYSVPSGSAVWGVIDKDGISYEISRQELSNMYLELASTT